MTNARKTVVLLAGVNILVGLMGYGASPLSLRSGLSMVPGGLLSLIYVAWALSAESSGSVIRLESALPAIGIITWAIVLLAYRPKEMQTRHKLIGLGTLIVWYGLGVGALFMLVVRTLAT
jgi:hypothetical protein